MSPARFLLLAMWVAHISGRHISPRSTLILNLSEAEKHCSPPERLPLPKSQAEQRMLEKRMQEAGYYSIWLAGRRRRLDKWVWVNGQATGEIKGKENQHCAVFGQDTGTIFPSECSEAIPGHICEVQYCNSCDEFGWMSHVCRRFGNKCYFFHCDGLNWYNARTSCINSNWDLAIIPDKAVPQWLAGQDFNCEHFWVGLKREEWVNKGKTKSLYRNWAITEPSVGDCLQMKYFNNDIYWASSDCRERKHFICVSDQGLGGPSYDHHQFKSNIHLNSTEGTDIPKLSTDATITIVIVAVIIFIVIAAIITVVLFIKRKTLFSGREEDYSDLPLVSGDVEELQKLLADRSLLFERVNLSSGEEMNLKPVSEMYTDLTWSYKPDLEPRNADYKDYFAQEEKLPKVTLISGENGIGKTTLVRMILHDWANYIRSERKSDPCLRRLNFVVYLMLSKVKEEKTLEEIMINLLKLKREQAQGILHSIEESLDKSLIIFDGYDELRGKKIEDIEDIINGRLYNGVRILITCKLPTAKYLDLDAYDLEKTRTVEGFMAGEVNDYINKYPMPDEQRLHLREAIQQETWGELAKYPHILRFLCALQRQHKKRLDRCTVYEKFIEYSCKRYNRKHPSSSQSNKHDASLKQIGKLAMVMLQANEPTIPSESLISLTEEAKALGFFTFKDEHVHFLNNEIQEFFCGYYLMLATPKERHEVFTSLSLLPNPPGPMLQLTSELVGKDKSFSIKIKKELTDFPQLKELVFQEEENSDRGGHLQNK